MKSLLAPIAACFRLGAAARVGAYHRGWLSSARVGRPVISVGNLSLGGTGKTMMVAHVAQILAARGLRASILTRGYGRAAGSDLLVIPPGASPPPDPHQAGDEPALLAALAPEAAVIVCTDRARAAKVAEEQFRVDAHILDDGFQHLAIRRDLDIVLIDVTQEFSEGAVLPAGRLREPPSALARAGAIVLTRTELRDPSAVEAQAKAINPSAKVFRCATRLRGFADLLGGRSMAGAEILERPAMAICGIGNPRAFFSNLRQWGVNIVAKEPFRDHHRYTRKDVRGILTRMKQSGATALVMTEKDAVNFPWREMPEGEIVFAACSIRPEINDVAQFEEVILDAAAGGRSGA